MAEYLQKMPGKDQVEVVAMDLHQGFVNAIGKHMPKAVRVAGADTGLKS